MKPTFHHRAVNSHFDDPSLYVRFLREKRALLFDAGDIRGLGQADMLKISDLFVSHTHIDHFIGFDMILRALLRRETPLRVFGPSNIADCLEGKLRGYTWNVITEYPLKLEVYAVHENALRHSSFHAGNYFRRIDRDELPFSGLLLEEKCFRVRAASIRHDIQCLGFSLEEDRHININKDALEKMGLPVGPWLGSLKSAIREGAPGDREFDISGRTCVLDDLRHLATITRGQRITYVTDASPDEENIEAIKRLAQGSDTFYCEAYFLDEDLDRARERNHLTGAIAGRIAREARVKSLVPIHFSPRYLHGETTPGDEALREFEKE